MAGLLQVDVFNSGYRPIPSALPAWPNGWQATWPATSAALVSGDRDGILVDALVTRAESQELADWLTATGKRLKQIYITHGHADHFFGLNTVLDTFPDARAVTLTGIVPSVIEQTVPEAMTIWQGIFPDQLFEKPTVPTALDAPEMSVEGHVVVPIALGQSDVPISSVVHVPDLDTLIAGDTVYNDIHVWMFRSDHDRRMAWIATLDEIEKLRPKTIIAGHRDPDAPDNDGPRLLNQTRDYIHDFDMAVAECASGQEIVTTMAAKYPRLGNPYTLWLAAYAQPFDSQSGASGTIPNRGDRT